MQDGRKKGKRRELTLEALSVSQNFDPESYVIPLQNKWTLDYDNSRASDASNNDERHLLSNVSNDDDLVIYITNFTFAFSRKRPSHRSTRF